MYPNNASFSPYTKRWFRASAILLLWLVLVVTLRSMVLDNMDDNPPPNLLLNDNTITIDFVVHISFYLYPLLLDLSLVTDVHCLFVCLQFQFWPTKHVNCITSKIFWGASFKTFSHTHTQAQTSFQFPNQERLNYLNEAERLWNCDVFEDFFFAFFFLTRQQGRKLDNEIFPAMILKNSIWRRPQKKEVISFLFFFLKLELREKRILTYFDVQTVQLKKKSFFCNKHSIAIVYYLIYTYDRHIQTCT